MKRFGFTIAEVLITLGIIGVVAAITIPTLIQKQREKAFHTAWKKTYAVMSNAILLTAQDYGGSFSGAFASNKTNTELRDAILKHVQYIKSCKETVKDGCWHTPENWWQLSGHAAPVTNASKEKFPAAILKDGTLIQFAYISSPVDCNNNEALTHADVDINGFKKPNVIGKDIYRFNILCNGSISPAGVKGDYYDTNAQMGCDLTANKIVRGFGCSAKYLSE